MIKHSLFPFEKVRIKYLFFILLTNFLLSCTPSPTVSYKTSDIQALAQTVKADDIIMYSTPDCIYCNQVKGWLNQSHLESLTIMLVLTP